MTKKSYALSHKRFSCSGSVKCKKHTRDVTDFLHWLSPSALPLPVILGGQSVGKDLNTSTIPRIFLQGDETAACKQTMDMSFFFMTFILFHF